VRKVQVKPQLEIGLCVDIGAVRRIPAASTPRWSSQPRLRRVVL